MVTFAQKIQQNPLVQIMFDLTLFWWYNAKIQPNNNNNNNHDGFSCCFHEHDQCYLCQFCEVAAKMVIICKNM
jgi:hypothetical protein